jgi:hypothetical protein
MSEVEDQTNALYGRCLRRASGHGAFESFGQRERGSNTRRTGAQKFDPAYPTNVFPYHVSQDVSVDVERGGTVDCGIGLGLALAIRIFEVPVPLDGIVGLGVIRGGHVWGERR